MKKGTIKLSWISVLLVIYGTSASGSAPTVKTTTHAVNTTINVTSLPTSITTTQASTTIITAKMTSNIASISTRSTPAPILTSPAPPSCSIPKLIDGDVLLTNGSSVGSVATFTCNDDYYINGSCEQSVTSECLQNEAWNISIPTCVAKGDGVSFSFSKNPFVEDSSDWITMTCSSSLPLNIFKDISIRKKHDNSWEPVVTLFNASIPSKNMSSDLAKKSIVSGSFKDNITLTLTVNESALVCEDEGLYQCYASYTNQYGGCYSEVNEELKGLFLPKAVILTGRKNSANIENTSASYPVQMKLGDTLSLSCAAHIGNTPNVTVTWYTNTAVSNGNLLPITQKKEYTQASDIKNCQYIRSFSMNHTVDTTDLSTGNITYSCHVSVTMPSGSVKDVASDKNFFLEIYCKNLTSPSNGRVLYKSNSLVNSSVEIVCDDGYKLKGQNTSVCQVNGQWSNTVATCALKDCSLPSPPDNGQFTFDNYTTFVNDSVSFSCYPGYKLIGTATITCTESGTWSDSAPLCIIQSCSTPELIDGDVLLTNGSSVGSVATFTCNDNYYINGSCEQSVTSECLQNEAWNISIPTCVAKGDHVSFNFSKNPFVEDSSDLITMTCSSSLPLDSFQDISIRKKRYDTWETLALLNSSIISWKNMSSDLAKNSIVDGSVGDNITLTLTVNESALACEDEGLYQCYVRYTDENGQCDGEVNEELKGFFFPKAATLEGSINGVSIENSSLSYPTQVKVGDSKSLKCTGKIGNDPNATISWMSSFVNGILMPVSPMGNYSKGPTIKDDDCQYVRIDKIDYTMSATDLSIGNISYLCYVKVFTPGGQLKQVDSDRVYLEMYELCPRPPPIMNGDIVITGTSNGSMAVPTCDNGFQRSTGFATCTSSGQWSTVMKCTKIDCKNLTSPLNGRVLHNNNTLVNSSAEIVCDDGYKLKGQNTSECQVNGQWSNTLATCDLKDCSLPSLPDNGQFTFDNYTTFVNDSVSFSCYPGYKLTGTATITCTESGTWTDLIPSCIIQNCTFPTAPSNGLYNPDIKLGVNSTTTLLCEAGYELSGNGTIQCSVNGSWTPTSANCSLLECQPPDAPNHGYATYVVGRLSVNDTVSYSCFPGYELDGVNATSCTVYGTWQYVIPNCNVLECPSPLAPDNGQVVIDNGKMEVNDTITFSCYPGYKLDGMATTMCNNNGTWNDTQPTCIVQNCSAPTIPENGYITSTNGNSVNSSVKIACNEGYSLDGNGTIQCIENATWSTLFAVCSVIECPVQIVFEHGHIFNKTAKYKFNDTSVLVCDAGYTFDGADTATCNKDGKWNMSSSGCIPKNCTQPSAPSNSFYIAATLYVNSTAFLVCEPGYNLSGNGTIKCTDNGTWTQPSAECSPIECPELQVPVNGRIVLSNQTNYNSKGVFYCNQGYYLTGSNETECTLLGNWTNSKTFCHPVDCGNWTNFYENSCVVSYTSDTLYGSIAICSCEHGYHIIESTKKSISTTCEATGIWKIQYPPLCVPIECPYINVSESLNVEYSRSRWFMHTVDTTATFSCRNNDSRISGRMMVTCLTNGQWSGNSPQCVEIDTTIPPCSDDAGWNGTEPGTFSVNSCPEGYSGESSRFCSKKGEWQLPVDNCIRKEIARLDNRIEAIKENPTEKSVTEALADLDKVTNTSSLTGDQTDITSGELEKVTSILDTIVDISNKSSVTTTQAESFLNTASNLLNTDNAKSWEAISQKPDKSTGDTVSSGASKILDVVGRYSDVVVSLLNNSKDVQTKTIVASNLVMHVAKVQKDTNVLFPIPGEKTKYNSSFYLPKDSLKGLTHVSSVLYKNLSGILSSRSISDGNETKKHEINSEVVSVKIPNWKSNEESFKLTLTFDHFQKNTNVIHNCSFWNEKQHAWDGEGCTKKPSSRSTTVCECNHLTNFAILMSPWEKENVDTKALDIISTVGCSISLIALAVTIVFHAALWKYVKSDRVVILINLSVALVISYAIFLGGVDRTENKDVCTSVAVLLQYIYLVVFFLMLAEGIEISVSVLYVFTTASRLKWLLPAAWLIPAVIVGISLGATQLKGYGNEQFCWLSVEGGLIWAFVAPAFIIIIVNFVLLILVLRAAFGARSLAQKSKAERTKAGVKCLCVLLPLMGCTWVIGIFYVNKDMGWIQYVFAVCNSLQGLVIFLFHCALNKQIRMAIERRKRKYASSLLSTASSTKKFSMPRVSTSSFSDRMDSTSNSFSREQVSFKSRTNSERRQSSDDNYEMISAGSLHSSLMQKRL